MGQPQTLTYERDGRVARITLDRPERGNGITLEMPAELAAASRRPTSTGVHVIALAGNGTGFCGGYDLGAAEQFGGRVRGRASGRPVDPAASPPTTTRGPGTRSSTSR